MKIRAPFVILIALSFVCTTLYAGNGAKDKAKLFTAKQEYLGGRYQKALEIYKELYEKNNTDGSLAFSVGECYFALGRYNHSLDYFEKAKEHGFNSNPEIYLYLGRVYQSVGSINKALEAFEIYRGKAGSLQKVSESRVDYYIAQCKTATDLMSKPVDVKIENLGEVINSSYDDKAPLLSPNGKQLFFNTRRPAGNLSITDNEGDNKYFDDIYYSSWDEINNEWSPAEPIPGNVNYPEAYDACSGISPDGKQLLIYKNEDFISQSGDIFISQLGPTNKWQSPVSIGSNINTPYYEDGACFSPDGNTIYFVSERKGGYGKSDIYMSNRISGNDWEKPVNLGDVVNSPEDEVGVFMASDGKTLFFCSTGHNSMGSYDIFKTVFDKGVWTKPVNLGYPINSTRRDGPICFDAEGKIAYFSSDRAGGAGETDIYKVDMTRYTQFTKPVVKKKKKENQNEQTGLSVIKGMVVDFEAGQAMETEIGVYDEYGQKITTAKSNIDGEYSITLPGDKKYELRIKAKNYKPFEEKIFLPVVPEEEFILQKDISVHRN